MTLLSIFNTGGLTLVLTIIAIGLSGNFFWRAYRASQSDSYQDTPTGTKHFGKMPIYKLPSFWMGVAVIVLYIIAMLVVASDYKGV